MRHIVIDPKKQPDCLKGLYERGNRYIDLKDDCLTETRAVLLNEQKGYCAYCEQKFKSVVFIEHYISQSEDSSKELDFENFLGICSGKEYFDPKKSPKHIAYCGDNRGSTKLNIDPKDINHTDQIYYESDGAIRSINDDCDNDLCNVLNLNFEILKRKREHTFKRNLSNLLTASKLFNWSKDQLYDKGISNSENGLSEFSAYLKYRYSSLKAKVTQP